MHKDVFVFCSFLVVHKFFSYFHGKVNFIHSTDRVLIVNNNYSLILNWFSKRPFA